MPGETEKRDPCDGHELHEATEHNVAERIIEAVVPNADVVHEQRLEEACHEAEAEKALHNE